MALNAALAALASLLLPVLPGSVDVTAATTAPVGITVEGASPD
jgi:hypothetical protein